MKQLSAELLASDFPFPPDLQIGVKEKFPERIIQFGEGNFLRAFSDWMVDRLNEETDFGGSIVIVQAIRVGIAHLVNDQDGLYTLYLRGISGGEVREYRRVVTAVSRGLNAYEQWQNVIEAFCQPRIRFLFSNTTEAGIAYQEESCSPGKTPHTFPAKVTALLYERFRRFSGDPSKGLVIMPCELIDRNGDNLKRIVLEYARDWHLKEEFIRWVESYNYFLNTLVDRIVPGYPKDEAGELLEDLGYEDKLIDTGEDFHLWVIEGPKHLAEEIPFHKIGLNVIWTDNMAPYRTRKVRILNGAHTSSVLAAYLGGLNTVRDMMEDEIFGAYVRKAVLEEVVPTIDMPREEILSFAGAVMERFRNPFIRHELLSISLNSISKWKVRVLPSLLDFWKREGMLPPVLTFSLAALISFYNGVGTAERELRGQREKESYPIRDDSDVLSFMEKRWHAFGKNHDLKVLAATVLSEERLWGRDLSEIPGFVDLVTRNLQSILYSGMRNAVKELLEGE